MGAKPKSLNSIKILNYIYNEKSLHILEIYSSKKKCKLIPCIISIFSQKMYKLNHVIIIIFNCTVWTWLYTISFLTEDLNNAIKQSSPWVLDSFHKNYLTSRVLKHKLRERLAFSMYICVCIYINIYIYIYIYITKLIEGGPIPWKCSK